MVANLVPAALMVLWVVLHERRHVKTMGFRRPGRGVLLLLLGIPIGAAIISIPVLFLRATGAYELTVPPANATTGWFAVALVLTHVVQGGNEEVLIRSFLLQNSGLQLPGLHSELVMRTMSEVEIARCVDSEPAAPTSAGQRS